MAALTATPTLPFADDPELAALLAASVQAHTAAAEASASKTSSSNPFAGDEQQDLITFGADDEDDDGGEDDEDEDEEPATAADRIARERSGKDDWQQIAKATLSGASSSRQPSTSNAQASADAAFDDLETGQGASAALSQRARKKAAKEARADSAGDAWFGMPRLIPTTSSASAPSNGAKLVDLTPAQRARALTAGHKNATVAADARSRTAAEIAREVQAIRLRNALDPKRFYRGARGDRAMALPEFAQIGTIVPDAHAPRQNLARSQRSINRGSVVEELLRDDTAKDYATRKFSELQDARGSWQAGKGEKRKGGPDGKKGGKKKQRK
ncbi:dTDP-fucopyranose mutase [Tilletia horrida]|uniref:dTDP-fucopyranose mutase n=1 Tax=Tilletia horrida TaxID=155126 RepID=A0AAN6GC34_9BASI|nr:dTDP-fucopyranose mutase [Tilletia horrida]KAK0526880.1 dTDP-fucopyranose mutase [Tilletia horrida]KAK0533031.1 dTDP-fucopyranose mutase [Tilletia horrida]KAK0555486.1 dTDP-fucopyranose mutase [Tilletia horrida]